MWGLDLSGSLQGAGGVGGLLAVVKDSATYYPAFDGNGNVMEYVSTDGTLVAHYEYSPFGETVIQSGDMADAFAFRFSTKYWENEAKLYYYGYRFFVPGIGRWLNRDPLGERGGPLLYSAIKNRIVNRLDYLGTLEVGGVASGVYLFTQQQTLEEKLLQIRKRNSERMSGLNCLLKKLLDWVPTFIENPTTYLSSSKAESYFKNGELFTGYNEGSSFWTTYVEPFAEYYFENGYDDIGNWYVNPDTYNAGAYNLPWQNPVINEEVFLTDDIMALSLLLHEPQHDWGASASIWGHPNKWDDNLGNAFYEAQRWANDSPYPLEYCCIKDKTVVKNYYQHFIGECGL